MNRMADEQLTPNEEQNVERALDAIEEERELLIVKEGWVYGIDPTTYRLQTYNQRRRRAA